MAEEFHKILMTPDTAPPSATSTLGDTHESPETSYDPGSGIDISEILARLRQGLPQIFGFGALGIAVAALIFLVSSPFTAVTTSMRVTFGFSGYGKGEYPDHSKFQPDDLRAPDVVADAIARLGLPNEKGFASEIRAALTVEGLIPQNIVKERDRLRAAGQTPGPYVPDEYLVSLTLPRKFPINNRQRGLLLNELASVFHAKFQRTYADIPLAFGNAFESLRSADYYEYEIILNEELQNITAYLNQQLDQAKTYRSPTTNFSFNDLLSQTELFSQIDLYETLGLIRQYGLSRNRAVALVKMDYYLRTLGDRERKAIEEEKVIDDLLSKTQERAQHYVLGIKSQVTQQHFEAPILDQGLIDSLLANDSSNFLVRQALAAGLKVKFLQSQKAQLLERREDMEELLKQGSADQSAILTQVQKSLKDLEVSYNELIKNIRMTHADFARQQFADAVRISMQPITEARYTPIVFAAGVGGLIGVALGVGLSLLAIYVGTNTQKPVKD